MIPQKIQALFDFIDYLDNHKTEYIEKYIPLCNDLLNLDIQRGKLKPDKNYNDKQQYDKLQAEIAEKFQPLRQNIHLPILNKLRELEIWAGDDVYTSIFNNNIPAISDFKKDFESEDITQVMSYKQKYLSFRVETNTTFLGLQFVFSNLDEVLKSLFDFFKDTEENEFDTFETKTIEVNSMEDAIRGFLNAKGKNVKFSFPNIDFLHRPNRTIAQAAPPNINTEIIMGNKIQVGDITNSSGNVINTGNGNHIENKIAIYKGDFERLHRELAQQGIDEEDITEIREIVKHEKPDKTNNRLGEKSNSWISKIINKSLNGVGKIATGISANLLATIIKNYYGMP